MAIDAKAIVFQGHRKFKYLFFCFWLCLLFCKLLWSGLDELVLVMVRDPCCSIDKLYWEYESWFLETIGVELSKEWREVDKEQIYEAG